MEVIKFVIHEKPFACWDWELQRKNLEFLEGVDSKYFSYIAKSNIPNIEGDDKHRAALSLRLSYSHGLETLFALLCSAIQAPQCTIGWILQYKNTDLVDLVRKISREETIYSRFKETPVTWRILAKHIHAHIEYDDEKRKWIQEGFGKLWSLLTADFIDDNFALEYNGIKHGLRARPGGFQLAYGPESVRGVFAPPEKMVSLGGSTFGSSYFSKEYIIQENKMNFRPRRNFRNWSPINIVNGLLLVSMSINNVISFLRIANGIPASECRFENPTDRDAFELPWKESVGVNHMTMDSVIEQVHVRPFSKEDILKSYK